MTNAADCRLPVVRAAQPRAIHREPAALRCKTRDRRRLRNRSRSRAPRHSTRWSRIRRCRSSSISGRPGAVPAAWSRRSWRGSRPPTPAATSSSRSTRMRVPELGERFGIRSIPTMAVFEGGREVARTSGARPAADIETFVGQAVSTAQKRALTAAASACRCACALRWPRRVRARTPPACRRRCRGSSSVRHRAYPFAVAPGARGVRRCRSRGAVRVARRARRPSRPPSARRLGRARSRPMSRTTRRPASPPRRRFARRSTRFVDACDGFLRREAIARLAHRRRAPRDPARHGPHARHRQPPEGVLHRRRSALRRHAVPGQGLPLARPGGDLRRGHPPAARRARTARGRLARRRRRADDPRPRRRARDAARRPRPCAWC